MEKEFVTYEIALKLKELGFDKECLMWYCHENNLTYDLIFKQYKEEDYFCNAPLWQQAIDWLMRVHNMDIEITRYRYYDTFINSWTYNVFVKVFNESELDKTYFVRNTLNNTIFTSYEEAREEGIIKAIEICQQKI